MNITIPPAALEAGADIIRDYRKAGVTSDKIARAAFLAMLQAWPGMECNGPSGGGVSQEPLQPSRIILPLPAETSDG